MIRVREVMFGHPASLMIDSLARLDRMSNANGSPFARVNLRLAAAEDELLSQTPASLDVASLYIAAIYSRLSVIESCDSPEKMLQELMQLMRPMLAETCAQIKKPKVRELAERYAGLNHHQWWQDQYDESEEETPPVRKQERGRPSTTRQAQACPCGRHANYQ